MGPYAKTAIEIDLARAATKDEILNIQKRAQDTGLIFQTTNCEHGVFICACCNCCCGLLRGLLYGGPGQSGSTKSNFQAVLGIELCNGCQACIKICPAEAFTLDRKTEKPVLNLEKCIGCGLCVTACPKPGALVLERKKESEITTYPHTWQDWLRIHAHDVGRTEFYPEPYKP